jgi:hypothetical protein
MRDRPAKEDPMEISSLSMDSARSDLLDRVGISMLAKGLKETQSEAEDLLKSLAPLPEGSGTRIDLLA